MDVPHRAASRSFAQLFEERRAHGPHPPFALSLRCACAVHPQLEKHTAKAAKMWPRIKSTVPGGAAATVEAGMDAGARRLQELSAQVAPMTRPMGEFREQLAITQDVVRPKRQVVALLHPVSKFYSLFQPMLDAIVGVINRFFGLPVIKQLCDWAEKVPPDDALPLAPRRHLVCALFLVPRRCAESPGSVPFTPVGHQLHLGQGVPVDRHRPGLPTNR